LLTAPNGLQKIRKYSEEDVKQGRFDPLTNVEKFTEEWDTPSGKKSIVVREHGFTPTELILLFNEAGLKVEHVWGGTAGNWGRRNIDLDEMEIMVVARKLAAAR
jgi:hypothetical protein